MDLRDEYQKSRAWWQDDRNFGSIIEPDLAARWRPVLYGLGFVAVLAVLARLGVLPVEVNWTGTLIGLGMIAVVAVVVEVLDPRERPRHQAPADAPPVVRYDDAAWRALNSGTTLRVLAYHGDTVYATANGVDTVKLPVTGVTVRLVVAEDGTQYQVVER